MDQIESSAEPHPLHESHAIDGAAPIVFVVDGSREYRVALSFELTAAGYPVRSFESAEQFLADQDAETAGCVLLEFALPGMNGLELQRSLVGSPCARPIVFFTDKGDIHTSVQAMKAGAVDFLTKPIDDDRLIAAIEEALRRDAEQRQGRAVRSMIEKRLGALTRRERHVMAYIIRGRLNKHIGVELGIHEKTVKVHRGRVMKKMRVRSVAELVHLGAIVGMAGDSALRVTN